MAADLVGREWGERVRRAEKAFIPKPNVYLAGLAKVHEDLVAYIQSRRPQKTATLDMDATLVVDHGAVFEPKCNNEKLSFRTRVGWQADESHPVWSDRLARAYPEPCPGFGGIGWASSVRPIDFSSRLERP